MDSDLIEMASLWENTSSKGNKYLSGKTSDDFGEKRLIGFYKMSNASEKSPDIVIKKKGEDKDELEDFAALWKKQSSDNVYYTGKCGNNQIVAFNNKTDNDRAPKIRVYAKQGN